MSEKSDQFISDLLDICRILVDNSGGRIELIQGGGTEDIQVESAHFLKFDGIRLGRDIELLGLMGSFAGFDMPLMEFSQSMAQIKARGCLDAWEAARDKCKNLEVYLEKNKKIWRDIFSVSTK